MRSFEAYTWQHLLPLLFFTISGFFLIRWGKQLNEKAQRQVGFILSVIVLAFMVGGSIIKLSRGTFDYKDDLPLYLCRLIAWALPIVMWYRNRFWAGIFYFWVLAGTLQGLITPDLDEGFPDYFYFRYWFLHAGLVITTLYAVLVFRVRIRWQHFWLAIGFAQVYIIIIHIINVAIGSNYSYTIRKPPGSILDFMGPWPWYILAGEGLMVVLFLLLMLPWLRRENVRM